MQQSLFELFVMSGQIKKILTGQVYKRISGQLKENMQFTSYVVSDDRIITGQNPQSSKEIAEAVVKRLSSMK